MPVAPPVKNADEFVELRAAPAWTWKQRALLALVSRLAPALIVGLGRTLRIALPNGVPPHAFDVPPPPAIYVFWHRDILTVAHIARGRGYGVLVSQHFDGELISQAAQRLGYVLFRGSSTRGGQDALQDMTRALDGGQPIALTVDGPRGPRFHAKAGAIQLARATGAPIYALHAAPRHCWVLRRSWDRMQIPKPFSRVRGVWAGPMTVPKDAGPEQVEELRQAMEDMLNRLRRENDMEEETA